MEEEKNVTHEIVDFSSKMFEKLVMSLENLPSNEKLDWVPSTLE